MTSMPLDHAFTASKIVDTLSRQRRASFDLDGRGTVYLRLSVRVIDGEGHTCLDVADITVREPFRTQGVFSESLLIVEAACVTLRRECVYVQSIVNPILRPALERRGYRVCMGIVYDGPATLDMFKPVLPQGDL